MTDELKVFRDMLDHKNWPCCQEDMMIMDGEIWEFLPTDDPEEERIRKALFKGAMQ